MSEHKSAVNESAAVTPTKSGAQKRSSTEAHTEEDDSALRAGFAASSLASPLARRQDLAAAADNLAMEEGGDNDPKLLQQAAGAAAAAVGCGVSAPSGKVFLVPDLGSPAARAAFLASNVEDHVIRDVTAKELAEADPHGKMAVLFRRLQTTLNKQRAEIATLRKAQSGAAIHSTAAVSSRDVDAAAKQLHQKWEKMLEMERQKLKEAEQRIEVLEDRVDYLEGAPDFSDSPVGTETRAQMVAIGTAFKGKNTPGDRLLRRDQLQTAISAVKKQQKKCEAQRLKLSYKRAAVAYRKQQAAKDAKAAGEFQVVRWEIAGNRDEELRAKAEAKHKKEQAKLDEKKRRDDEAIANAAVDFASLTPRRQRASPYPASFVPAAAAAAAAASSPPSAATPPGGPSRRGRLVTPSSRYDNEAVEATGETPSPTSSEPPHTSDDE